MLIVYTYTYTIPGAPIQIQKNGAWWPCIMVVQYNMPTKGYRKTDGRTKRLRVRVTPEQFDAYSAAAGRAGRAVSGWVRSALDAMAKDKGEPT